VAAVTGDLADFLLARIAEDEEFALRYPPTAAARPRALAECSAKRGLIAYCTPDDDTGNALLSALADPSIDAALLAQVEPFARAMGAEMDRALLHVLRYLALPYADHPEFREEWRP
jgi:hypothetical protein